MSMLAQIDDRLDSQVTRREALHKLSAGALLSLGLWTGCATSPKRAEYASFDFIVVNDTHYMSEECGRWLETVVNQMKSHSSAEFCLLAGDLVEVGHRAHLGAVSDVFGALGIPVYTQIGNHDYLTHEDRTGYESVFPKRLNYVFRKEGWQFVGFDSTEGTKYEGTRIQPPSLDWLRETASGLDRRSPTILFTHFPLGEGVRYRPVNADDALTIFREHNLKAIFSGHFHGSTEREWNGAPVMTNRCCALKRNNHDGTKEKGYFYCRVKDSVLSREFVQVPAFRPPARTSSFGLPFGSDRKNV